MLANADGGTDNPVEREKAPCSIDSFANFFIFSNSPTVALRFSTDPEAICNAA